MIQSALEGPLPILPFYNQISHTQLIEKMKYLSSSWFASTPFSTTYHSLSKELPKMTKLELNLLLKSFFDEIIKDGKYNPIEALDRIASFIPLNHLINDHGSLVDIFYEVEDRLSQAQEYFDKKNDSLPSSLKHEISHLFSGTILLIGTLTKLIDITSFMNPEEQTDEFMIQYRVHMMLEIFTLLSTIIASYAIGLSTTTITAIVFSLVALATLWKYLKPMSGHLEKFRNLTNEIQDGVVKVNTVCNKPLVETAEYLEAGRNVLFIAPSRSGKTETLYAFVKAIIKGQFPELLGKTVFYVSTAEIVQMKNSSTGSGASNYLKRIHNEIKQHADDIILVFEEIHCALMPEAANFGEILKSYFEDNGKFPHVIGITTTEEYNKHIKGNEAFDERFAKVKIENTTEQDTIRILNDYCLRNNKDFTFSKEALQEIYNITSKKENAKLPRDAVILLNKCFNKTKKGQLSENKLKYEDLKTERDYLRSLGASTFILSEQDRSRLRELSTEITILEQTLAKEKKEINHLFKTLDFEKKTKIEIFSVVIRVCELAAKTIGQNRFNTSAKKELKKFLLLDKFLRPALTQHVNQRSHELNLITAITPQTVKDIAEVA